MKKNVKSSRGSRGSKSHSSLAVPHGSEVANHFSPSKVEQHGLGPAFFAVVIAVIALILLSIFGNSYLTGSYHLAKGSDYVRLQNITFTPLTSPYRMDVGNFTGRVTLMRVTLPGPVGQAGADNDMYFGFYGSRVRAAFVVTSKIDPTALPVGSIVYSEPGGLWRLYLVDARYYQYRGLASPRIPLFTAYYAPQAYTPLLLELSLIAPVPNMTAKVSDYIVYPHQNGSLQRIDTGIWTVNWTPGLPVTVWYFDANRYISKRVWVGFESPGGSKLIRKDVNGVTIQYAYDTRWR